MRLTFEYQLEDGQEGTVTTRAADVAKVERKTGDLLTQGIGFNHCAMLVHSVLQREAKRDGGSVAPFEHWLENDLLNVDPVNEAPEESGDGDDDVPFEGAGSGSP